MLLETETRVSKKQKEWQKNDALKSKTQASHVLATVKIQDKHSLLSQDSHLESVFALTL